MGWGAVPQTEWSQTTRTDRKPDVETRGRQSQPGEVCVSVEEGGMKVQLKSNWKRKVKIAWEKIKSRRLASDVTVGAKKTLGRNVLSLILFRITGT